MSENDASDSQRADEAMNRYLAAQDSAADRRAANNLAPGWYRDPRMANTVRFWDGRSWTEHVAPQPPQPPTSVPAAHDSSSTQGSNSRYRSATAGSGPNSAAAADPDSGDARGKDDLTFAWAIALAPAALLPLDYFLPALAASRPVLFGGAVAILILAALDSVRLAKSGIQISVWWALLSPAYLIRRTIVASSTPAIPVVWFACAGLSVIGSLSFTAPFELSGRDIEQEIRTELRDQGVRRVDVDCPANTTATAGDRLYCEISDQSGQSSDVVVVVQDDGYYEWEVLG